MTLTGSFPRERPDRRCLDGEGEAHLIHLACGRAPDGRQRWTLELLADRMVKLGYVEHISPETVRKALKKTRLLPWLKKSWCTPSEADGDFGYRMEDVLDVYCQPYDPEVPKICMDEMGKNTGHQTSITLNQLNQGKWHEKITPTKKRAAPISSLPTNHWLGNAA